MRNSRLLGTAALVATATSVFLGAGVASAATISPAGVSFSAPGSITVRTPTSLGQPVTCNLTLNGSVAADGASASITSGTVSGASFLCAVPQLSGLPWTLTPTSATTGDVAGVQFSVLGATCGPATLSGNFNNMTNTLSASNQALPGNCTIDSLSVVPNPAFTLN